MPPRPQDVTPLIRVIREALQGRPYTNQLRFADELSVPARNQPPPVLPAGSTHLLSDNYYYTRDARRRVPPAVDVPLQVGTALAAGKKSKKEKKSKAETADSASVLEAAAPKSSVPRPGVVYIWDGQNDL